MLNVCLTIIIIIFLKWDVLSQNAPHVLACSCSWQRDRWAFFVYCPLSNACPLHSAPRTNLLSSAARIFADGWFSLKAQILSVFSSLFGSPLLSRSKLMIYVFMSSLLYLNRKNFIKIPSSLSCCRFWLIIRITINIIYLIVTVIPVDEFLLHLGQTSPVKYV